MLFNVVAEIEVDGKPVKNHISIKLDQHFNEHHSFTIRLPFDVLEADFSLNNVKDLLGKVTIIRLKSGRGKTVVNEFKGIITDVGIEQVDSSHSQIILNGSSPTIILDHGDHAVSFLEKNLEFICGFAANFVKSECKVTIKPVFKGQLSYVTQYHESSFDFLNRLSAEFGEWFFYDGKELFFGKPALSKELDLILGEDVTALQHKLQLAPLSSFDFNYTANAGNHNAKDPVFRGTPQTVGPLGVFGKHAAEESEKMFEGASAPFIRPHPNTDEEAKSFLKLLKLQKAAKLEVISGTSTNPEIHLGTIATILISKRNENFAKSEHGKYIITSVTHEILQDGRYLNHFEGLPSALEVIPVKNYKKVIAETQTAIVRSNNDPKKENRVRVQMLWQNTNATTDWISVMTPDAGLGNNDKKNRGYVFIPEVGDLVYIGFKYNDPNLPFVMGSVIDRLDAAGGGKDNKIKTISTKKGSIITFNDENGSVHVADAGGNSILLNGGGLISLNSAEKIELKCKESSITMDKDGNIEIKGKMKVNIESEQEVFVKAKEGITLKSQQEIALEATKRLDLASNAVFSARGTSEMKLSSDANLTVKGTELVLEGTAKAKLSSAAMAEISAAMVKIN